jgi:hypothetical protein
MIHSKFYPTRRAMPPRLPTAQDFIKPNEAAKIWAFNVQGEILWLKSAFTGMKFVRRGYTFDQKKIKEYAQDRNKGVIVAVEGNSHWLAVESWGLFGPVLIDPWTGETLWNWKKKYKSISGFALFEKTA